MPDVGGIVLCGGQSSRMGRPKAWLPFAGTTLLGHVAGSLAGVARPVGPADFRPRLSTVGDGPAKCQW